MPLAFDALVAASEETRGVCRDDIRPGDRVRIHTRNSVYELRALDDTRFEVQGGWFDRNGEGPVVLAVVGCTWGGSAVRRDLVAGCGMRTEFGNRVITSVIRRVVHFPGGLLN